MKNLILLFFCALSISIAAQDKSQGVLIYEQTVDMSQRIEEMKKDTAMMERFRRRGADLTQMIPEQQKLTKQLYFRGNETLFSSFVDEDEEAGSSRGRRGGMWRMRMMGGGNMSTEVYYNMDEAEKVEQKDFYGNNYVIVTDLSKKPWKLVGEQREIMGFTCMKAEFIEEPEPSMFENQKDEESEARPAGFGQMPEPKPRFIEAWFTSEIPSPGGPENFNGLPGMILELAIDHGVVVYKLKSVDFKEIKAKDLKRPARGKEVTNEEFTELVREQMKVMRESQQGGSGRTYFRH